MFELFIVSGLGFVGLIWFVCLGCCIVMFDLGFNCGVWIVGFLFVVWVDCCAGRFTLGWLRRLSYFGLMLIVLFWDLICGFMLFFWFGCFRWFCCLWICGLINFVVWLVGLCLTITVIYGTYLYSGCFRFWFAGSVGLLVGFLIRVFVWVWFCVLILFTYCAMGVIVYGVD